MNKQRVTLPPFARAIVQARDAGYRVGTVFIAHGWPSDTLRNYCTSPKFSEHFPSIFEGLHAIGTPENAPRYSWRFVVGLAVILWAESSVQAAILLRDVAPLVLACNPQLLQLWRTYPGSHDVVEFVKSTTDEVAHG
jgi:hypothetical protein